MPRYRRKPTDVEAVQFDPLGAHSESLPTGVTEELRGVFFVVTIQGVRTPIAAGEWVVTERDGIHHYPHDAVGFAKNYDLV